MIKDLPVIYQENVCYIFPFLSPSKGSMQKLEDIKEVTGTKIKQFTFFKQ
jgi:hypothetical protein